MEAKPGRQENDRHNHRSDEITEGVERTAARPSLWQPFERLATLAVDTRIFSVECVLKAAYKFTGTCHVWVERDVAAISSERCLVFLRAKHAGLDLATIAGEFSNELIDQRLRQRLEAQFGDLRTVIAAQAFSEGNLLNPGDGD